MNLLEYIHVLECEARALHAASEASELIENTDLPEVRTTRMILLSLSDAKIRTARQLLAEHRELEALVEGNDGSTS